MNDQHSQGFQGDAYGPGSSLQVLADYGSGLSVSPPIAPPREPILFDKARERNEYHWLQTLPQLDDETVRRRRAYRLKAQRKMMALLVELHADRP